MPGDESARDQWLNDYYRLPSVPAIAQALARGEVVVADREWDWRHHYNGWCGWGILTEARTDGTILGACLNGRRDNPMTYPEQCFAISSGSVSIRPNDVAVEAVLSAVQRVRGAGRFAPNAVHVFGLVAMDRWIQEMLDVPGFCAECQAAGRGWMCARNNAGTLSEGAHVVSTALRTHLGDRLSGPGSADARQHIRKAADVYARISERLRPAAQNDGDQGYESICPDLAAQQAHVNDVLLPAREDLQKAVIALECALAALGKR